MDRVHSHLCKGYGYLEYEKSEDAEKALKHMHGGQIDGLEIQCELTLPFKSNSGGGGGDRRHSPVRDRRDRDRASPPSRRPQRQRSPPPARITGANTIPLGNGRRHSRSRSPRR